MNCTDPEKCNKGEKLGDFTGYGESLNMVL